MLRNIFFKDVGWKLFSLLLAAFIWLTVHKILVEPQAITASTSNRSVTFGGQPVSIIATGADVHLYGVNSNTVSVTISGPPELIQYLQASQVKAMVDISDFDDKKKEQFRPVDVSVPWGIAVVDVEPAKLRIIPPPKP